MRYTTREQFEKENGYEIDGVWFPRVTRILEIKAKPGLDRFLREVGDYTSAETIKVKSAQEGSRVHEVAERILAGGEIDVPEEIRPAMDSLSSLVRERGIIVFPEFIERRVWSERHRYAGTIDSLAMIGGKIGVLDIKTSHGFYPEFNLQTAAYVSAFQEIVVRKALGCSFSVETRWILKINQHVECMRCSATKRVKGGHTKVRENGGSGSRCGGDGGHKWGPVVGDVDIREFPYNIHSDIRAFLSAKVLWEWENEYWLRKSGYV